MECIIIKNIASKYCVRILHHPEPKKILRISLCAVLGFFLSIYQRLNKFVEVSYWYLEQMGVGLFKVGKNYKCNSGRLSSTLSKKLFSKAPIFKDL